SAARRDRSQAAKGRSKMTAAITPPTPPLLDVADLAVSFDNGNGPRIQAVAGVNLTIHPGQTLAAVGESGCGKSVTAMGTMELIAWRSGRVDRGTIVFEGRGLLSLDERRMLAVRGKEIAMIFRSR